MLQISQHSKRKKFQFLFVGGLLYRKGIDLLLSAFLKTFSAIDPVRLIIRGSYRATGSKLGKSMSNDLDSMIRQAQAQEDAAEIIMLGDDAEGITDEGMAALYGQSDCYVLPYRGEVGDGGGGGDGDGGGGGGGGGNDAVFLVMAVVMVMVVAMMLFYW